MVGFTGGVECVPAVRAGAGGFAGYLNSKNAVSLLMRFLKSIRSWLHRIMDQAMSNAALADPGDEWRRNRWKR